MTDRMRVPACMLLFVLAQVALPLRYYWCPAHDSTDEQYAWRMISQQMWSHHDLVFHWRAGGARRAARADALGQWHTGVCAPRTYVQPDDHFSPIWVNRLDRGPRNILVRACEHLCARVPAQAASVHYEWTLRAWRHRGQPVYKRTLRGGATCARPNSTCPI